jgi:hypothetical protein
VRAAGLNAVALADRGELGVRGCRGEVDERRDGVLQLGDGHGRSKVSRPAKQAAARGKVAGSRSTMRPRTVKRLVEAQGTGELGGKRAGG